MGEAVTPQDITMPPSARRKRGFFARLVIAAVSACIMATLGMLALFVALSAGPISVPFIKERLALALEERIGSGIDVDVGEARLEKTENGFDIHVFDVAFRDAGGKDIFRAPEARIGVDALQLATLRVSPNRLALQGMTLRAEIRADGEIRLSTPQATDPAGQSAQLTDVLGALALMARTGTLSGLSEFSVRDARLVIDDKRVGRELVFDRMSAVFESAAAGRAVISGSARKEADIVPFRIAAEDLGDVTVLSLDVGNLTLNLAKAAFGLEQLPVSANSSLAVVASARIGQDGKAKSGSATVSLTPGAILVPALHEKPFQITQASVEAQWSGAADKIDMVTLRYAGDGSAGSVSGPLLLPGAANGEYRFEGRTEGLALSPLRPQDQPVKVTEGKIRASISRNLDALRIDGLELTGPETDLRLSGDLTQQTDGLGANVRIAAGPMPVRTTLRWWPFPIASGGRTYLADAVRGGTFTSFDLKLALPPAAFRAAMRQEALPAEALRIDFAVDGGTVQALDGLPAVAGLSGSGWLNARSSEVTASRGIVDLQRGAAKRIQLSDGSVKLDRLDLWTPSISIAFRAQAALDHVAEFINLPPLRDTFALKVNPSDIKGQFDGRAAITFPLGVALKAGDVRTEVTASVRNMTLEKAIGKDRLENANLAISADATGIDVKGEGRWQGIPVNVTLENDAQDKSSATVLSFTLDDAAQKRLGFGLAPQLSGPLPVKVRASRESGEGLRALAEIDLTRVAIDGLIPGFQKPAGRSGKLSFEAVERPKGYTLQNIALDSGVSSFRGQAEAQADGTITSARLSLFRLSPGDNVRLDFDRTSTGGKVAIRGNNFDARPFLRALQDGPPAEKADRDMDIELKTTLLSGHGNEVITSADLRLMRRGGQMRQINLTGRLNGKAISVKGQASDRQAPIEIDADDAGAFLRFLDIYTRMSGGDLVGQLTPSGRQVNGFFIARNFGLRNEPALRRLLSENATDGAQRVPDSASFTKMRLDFNRNGTTTTVKDAVIFGPQIGLTFNGTVDMVRDRISLSGTFIPAYGLNNAFAQIPVLGGILGGGRNEGLLAVTFGVSGRASQPAVTVNPLSAVAPGIFRKIFEFRNDRANSAPQPAQSANPIIPN